MSEVAVAGWEREPAPSKTTSSAWTVFGISSIAIFLVSIDATVLFAAFSALRAGFPSNATADVSWVLNAYTVVYAALLVPAGRLTDAHGRKRVFQFGLLVFLAASAACGAAPTLGVLIAARVLQAVGAALLTPSSLAIVLGVFSTERRAFVVSVWGAVGGLAAALGPSVGAGVVDALSWRWAFFLNLPFGIFAWWLGRSRLVESRSASMAAPVDVPGVVLLIVGVGALALGIVQSESLGWHSLTVQASLVGAFVALLTFVFWARRAKHPVVDLTLFADRTYSLVNLATLAFGTAFTLMFFAYFFFLTEVWHYSLTMAGLAVTPGPLLVMPVAVISGRIAARVGHRPLLVIGSVIYALGGLWFSLRLGEQPDYLHAWLPGLVFTGVAVGMVLPSLSGAAVAKLAKERFGIGSAVNQAVRQIAGVIGVAVAIALVGHAHPQLGDFHHLYATHIVLALLTAVLCLGVDTRPAQPSLNATQERTSP